MSEAVIVNGRVTDRGFVSIDDRGFTLGDGLFETIPLYRGEPFRLDYHMERLVAGAEIIKLRLPINEPAARRAIAELAKRNGVGRGVARLTVTRGAGSRGYSVEGCDRPSWFLTCRPYTPLAEKRWERGFALHPVALRKNPKSALAGLKTVSALEPIMILDEARRHGADEALAFTPAGAVASGAAMNIFWVKEGELETPSLDCGILPGVTRRIVIELAAHAKAPVTQGAFGGDALTRAQEVFVTNSLLEIVPVTSVPELFTASGPGPVTRDLASRYRALTGG